MRIANKNCLLVLSMLFIIFISYEIIRQETIEEKIISVEKNLNEADPILEKIEHEKYSVAEQLNSLKENNQNRESIERLFEQNNRKSEIFKEIISAMQGMKMQLFLYESYTDTYLQNELRYYNAMAEGRAEEQISSFYDNVYKLYNLDASIYMANYRMEHSVSGDTIIWQNIWNSSINIFSSIYVFAPLLFVCVSFGIMKELRSTLFSFLPKMYKELIRRELFIGMGKNFFVLVTLLCCILGIASIRIGELPRFEEVLYYDVGMQQFSFIHPLFLIFAYIIVILLVSLLLSVLKDIVSIYFDDAYIPLCLACLLTYFFISFPSFILNDYIPLLDSIMTFRQISNRMGGQFSWQQWGIYTVYIGAVAFLCLKIHGVQFEKLRKRK